MAEDGALCLDLTRLVSRVGRGPWTGIDRVEAAWLSRLLSWQGASFGLVRLRNGYALLDEQGLAGLSERLRGGHPWGTPDLRARLTPGLSGLAAAVESDLRRLARATSPRPLLKRLLELHVPAGCTYLNAGHANLTAQVFEAWAAAKRARIVVLVHDMIPLTHPGFQRPGIPERFEAAMRLAGQSAHLVVCVSQATRAEAEARFESWGRVPPIAVAPIGVSPAAPDPAVIPAGLPPAAPYFVTLGTIEPRKNHALLLDIWEGMEADMASSEIPRLLILGSRGWENAEVFARLDSAPVIERTVFERRGLPDPAVSALVRSSAGLLCPSRAEGFGLPPAEAAALGVPAICSELAIFREILGDYPVYADPDDPYAWRRAILDLAETARTGQDAARESPELPTWDDHFNLVLSRL